MRSTTAFTTTTTPVLPTGAFRGKGVCSTTQKSHSARHARTSQPRMEVVDAVQQQQSETTEPTVQTSTSWPPPEMTEEWAEAVLRLANSVKGASLESADQALGDADGDEILALKYLTEDNRSDIQIQRERVVEAARAAGDFYRVSAMKEAELRRTATGSARDFFKGFVEVEGQYVDSGYVDESADTMGRIMGTVKGWFGKNE